MDELRIAIADDEQQILDSVKIALGESFSDKKLEVKPFKTLDKLIKFLKDDSSRIDLLLLDCFFPTGMTGLQALPIIRKYAQGLPIIMLTSNDNPADFKPYHKYKFKYLAKADTIEHTQASLQINIEEALAEKNKFQDLRKEVSYALTNWNPPSNIINTVATGQLLFNEYGMSQPGMDLAFIGTCWGRTFEAAVKAVVKADRSSTLSDDLRMLISKTNAPKEFKDILYQLKNLRNYFSHEEVKNIGEINDLKAKFSIEKTAKILSSVDEKDREQLPTKKEIITYRKLFLGESGYTNGMLVKLLELI